MSRLEELRDKFKGITGPKTLRDYELKMSGRELEELRKGEDMLLTLEEIKELTLETAAKSKATKRKVGAVLAHLVNNSHWRVLSTGYNHNPTGEPCEDSEGFTVPEVVHAEIEALSKELPYPTRGFTMFVTHPPCEKCRKALAAAEVSYKVVDTFIKFDAGKLDTTVVASSVIRALAEMSEADRRSWSEAIVTGLIPASQLDAVNKVLVHGARKYKPNNWKEVKDKHRYVAAAQRHWLAYLEGQTLDADSGMAELWHIATNIAFLIELGYVPEGYSDFDLLSEENKK